MADVEAKDNSQETAVNFIGYLFIGEAFYAAQGLELDFTYFVLLRAHQHYLGFYS